MTQACPICTCPDFRPVLRKDGYTYVQCSACRHAWLSPLPTESEAAGLYTEDYFRDGSKGGYLDYEADEAIHRENARARLALLDEGHTGPRGALVDVGCAAGFFADEAQRQGWTAVGVEVSDYERERAQSRLGLRCVRHLSELSQADPFDAFCLFQVLEHMVDPMDVLGHARRLVRDGGSLIIETWDRSSAIAQAMQSAWQQVTPPSVIHLFDRSSLTEALRNAGFDVRFIRSTSKRISLGHGFGLLAEKSPGPLGAAFRRLSESRIANVVVPYQMGDLITAVATRQPDRA